MLPGEIVGIANHSFRNQLSNEVHARLYEQLTAPVQASLLSDEIPLREERAMISTRCERFG